MRTLMLTTAIRSGLFRGLAHEACGLRGALTCGLRRITLALLASLTGQAVGFGLHCWRREDQRREGIGRAVTAPRRQKGWPAIEKTSGGAVLGFAETIGRRSEP